MHELEWKKTTHEKGGRIRTSPTTSDYPLPLFDWFKQLNCNRQDGVFHHHHHLQARRKTNLARASRCRRSPIKHALTTTNDLGVDWVSNWESKDSSTFLDVSFPIFFHMNFIFFIFGLSISIRKKIHIQDNIFIEGFIVFLPNLNSMFVYPS